MSHRQQQVIDRILAQQEQATDHSLRAKALDRAVTGKVPKTLTPWEWQQWYEQNGIPESHRQAAGKPAKPWWRRWL